MWQKWSSFSPRATPNKRWAESVTESRWQLERKTEKKRTELFLFVLFSPEKPPAVMAFSSSSLAPHRHMSQRLSLQWRSVGPLAKRGLHTNPSTKALWCSPTYRIMVGMHWGLGDEQECFALLFWHTPQRAPPQRLVRLIQTALVIAEVTSKWASPHQTSKAGTSCLTPMSCCSTMSHSCRRTKRTWK